jgi:hypothetical protein
MNAADKLIQGTLQMAREALSAIAAETNRSTTNIGAMGEAKDIVLRALRRAADELQGDGVPPSRRPFVIWCELQSQRRQHQANGRAEAADALDLMGYFITGLCSDLPVDPITLPEQQRMDQARAQAEMILAMGRIPEDELRGSIRAGTGDHRPGVAAAVDACRAALRARGLEP